MVLSKQKFLKFFFLQLYISSKNIMEYMEQVHVSKDKSCLVSKYCYTAVIIKYLYYNKKMLHLFLILCQSAILCF